MSGEGASASVSAPASAVDEGVEGKGKKRVVVLLASLRGERSQPD